MQKHVHLVDLVTSFPTNIFLQNLASIQKRTSLIKFAHLAEKSGEGSISNLSTKVGRSGPGAAAKRLGARLRGRWDDRDRSGTVVLDVARGHAEAEQADVLLLH